MDSKPRVSLLAAQGRPPGSFPIRAPLTLDDDSYSSSEYASEGNDGAADDKDDDFNSRPAISSVVDNGSESEGFLSGEEFETASERPSNGDADEESQGESGFGGKYGQSVALVANSDQESLEDSSVEEGEDEESGVTDEYVPAVELLSRNSNQGRPIAQLSMDDDNFDELLSDEGMASDFEDGKAPVIVKDPSFGVLERVHTAPTVKVLCDEESSKVDAAVGKAASNDPVSSEFTEDESHLATEDQFESSVGSEGDVLKTNVETDKDVNDHASSAVSFELAESGDCLFTRDVPAELSMENKECVLEEYLKLDEQVKHPVKTLEQGNIELHDGEVGPKQSGVVKQIVEIVNGSEDDNGTVMKPVDKFTVAQLQEQKAGGSGLGPEGAILCQNNGSGSLTEGSVALILEGDMEFLEGKSRPESDMEFEPVRVETMDHVIEANDTQTRDSPENGFLPETLKGDGLNDPQKSNAGSLGIRVHPNQDSQRTRGAQKGLLSEEDIEELIFGGSRKTKHVLKGSEQTVASPPLSAAEGCQKHSQQTGGRIVVGSDDGVNTDSEHGGKKWLNSTALNALLKAATGAESGGSVTFSSANGSGIFSLKRPAGTDSSSDTMESSSPTGMVEDVVKENISEEEKKLVDKIQHSRVKFLRLVQRLGYSAKDPMVAQVLLRLALAAGGQLGEDFGLESAKKMAVQLEAEGKDHLDFSLNILVIGKTGVGKSATINSIFGEQKGMINAFQPATTQVNEIVGTIDGVRIRVLDTPGLRTPWKEEVTNRKILASIKKFIKKFPPDVVLYVDRLDDHAIDDLPLLESITRFLTKSIWRNAIVTLTHAASPPPDGPYGSPLSFELFVAQRSHVVRRAISKAVGDFHLMLPVMMHPVALVDNHPSSQKNLPTGQSWIPQLLLLCYSLKIISEVGSTSETGDSLDHKNLFGFRVRALSPPHLVSSLLQSRPHPRLPAEQGGGGGVDLDIDMVNLPDSEEEDEDVYDQLPPFKPLSKSQVDKLSKEHRRAYFDEYDYRVKLLQKKQLKEEFKRLKEMKKKSKDGRNDGSFNEENMEEEDGGPKTVPVLMPDVYVPPSFDSDNPSYRYRKLESTSELLVRPALGLGSQEWDHDCGYDGVSAESNLVVASQFPGAFAVLLAMDKRGFNMQLDSSICAKHGEKGSTLAEFDMQTLERQIACTLRGETKFKNFEINKTSAGICITILGDDIATGLKLEDQIAVGKRLSLTGSAGAVRSEGNTAYGANFEVRIRSEEFPLEQDQTSVGLSLVKWRGKFGLMANLQSLFSVGRSSKMAVRVGMDNEQNGQISIKTNSSELHIAFLSLVPIIAAIRGRIFRGPVTRETEPC